MRPLSFLYRLFVLAVLFVVVDQLTGQLILFLNSIAGDKFKREEFIRHEMKSDVVLLGSSRCAHHYVPSIFKDSLGMSAYNCGQRGNGIIYEYGRLQTIYDRYTPKLIVIDFIPGDFELGDNRKFLEFLKFDYGKNNSVDSLFYRIDKFSSIKMKIQSYKYNSVLCDMLLNVVLSDRGRFNEDGYSPMYGDFPGNGDSSFRTVRQEITLDSIKLYCIKEIASKRRENSDIVFVISPFYSQINSEFKSILGEVAKEYDIPLLDYSYVPGISCNPIMFKDMAHLNDDGAVRFSRMVAHDLKRMGYVIGKYRQ